MSYPAVPPIVAASAFVALVFVGSSSWLPAQQPVGTIEAASATISGTLSLTGGKALVGANAVITARDRTATLNLSRGGEILVCSTSALHAARGAGPSQPEPLLLALDRGAVEVHMLATAADTILTPDLRFTIATSTGQPAAGLLDLRMRVAANGDTCVENRGKTSPTLEVAEQFGTGLYQVHPNQHLLFEHGSLREVVDGETSPCGCPPPPVLSAADSGLTTDVTRAARPGARVADDPDEVRPHDPGELQHPFPAAESQGLTPSNPAASVPQAPPGERHAQVAATLAFNANGHNSDGSVTPPPDPSSGPASPASAPAGKSGPVANAGPARTVPTTPSPATPSPLPAPAASTPSSAPAAPSTAPATATTSSSSVNDKLSDHEVAQSPLPPPAPPPRTIAHRMGHFFRHLFGAR